MPSMEEMDFTGLWLSAQGCFLAEFIVLRHADEFLHGASEMGVIVLTSSVCLSVTTLAGERKDRRT